MSSKSPEWRAIRAILKKEVSSDLRARGGLAVTGMFGLITVFTLSFASFGLRLNGSLASGLAWAAAFFVAMSGVPRTLLTEEETGTADLLRLNTTADAVFWGKLLYNLLQLLVVGTAVILLFFVLTDVAITSWPLLLASIIAGLITLAASTTITAAVVSTSSNRSALASAIGMPLLFPLIFGCIGATRAALGVGTMGVGWTCCGSLAGYGCILIAVGPHLFKAAWKD